MNTRLIGCFSHPLQYGNAVLSIRSYYGSYLQANRIMVFAVMSKDEFSITEYLYTFNLISAERILFRQGDIALNKRGKALYSINGLNALLRDEGLQKGSYIDWDKYQGYLITEQGVYPQIQKLKFASYG